MIVNELTYERGFIIGAYVSNIWNTDEDNKPVIASEFNDVLEPFIKPFLTKGGFVDSSLKKLIKNWVIDGNVLNLNCYYEDPIFVKGIIDGIELSGKYRKIDAEKEEKMVKFLDWTKPKKHWLKKLLGL